MTKKLFADKKTASVVDFTGEAPPRHLSPLELSKLERRVESRNVRGKVRVETEMERWHFLRAPDTTLDDHRPGSRVSSKFGRGFNRRRPATASEDSVRFEEDRGPTEPDSAVIERRRKLNQADKPHGFNIISCAEYPDAASLERKPEKGRKYLLEEVTKRLEAEGAVALRESANRFFLPAATGPAIERRQQLQVSEGLVRERASSVLGIGRADLPSHGARDGLDRSYYAEAFKHNPDTSDQGGKERDNQREKLGGVKGDTVRPSSRARQTVRAVQKAEEVRAVANLQS